MKKGIFKSDYDEDRERKKMVPPTRNTGDINFSFRSVTQASEGSDLRLTGFESNLSEKKNRSGPFDIPHHFCETGFRSRSPAAN